MLGTEWVQLLSSRYRGILLDRLFWMLRDLGVTTNPKAKKLLKTIEYGSCTYYKEGLISLNDRAC